MVVTSECLPLSAPSNASVSCDASPPFGDGVICQIGCNAGYVSPTAASLSFTCIANNVSGTAVWSSNSTQLQCVPTVAVAIGGLAVDSSYTTDVQVR
jgi:hypothetical protein